MRNRSRYTGHRAARLHRELRRVMRGKAWRVMIAKRKTEERLPRMKHWNRLAEAFIQLTDPDAL